MTRLPKLPDSLSKLPSEKNLDYAPDAQIHKGIMKIKDGSYSFAVGHLRTHIISNLQPGSNVLPLRKARKFSELFDYIGIDCVERENELVLTPRYCDHLHYALYSESSDLLIKRIKNYLLDGSELVISELGYDDEIVYQVFRIEGGKIKKSRYAALNEVDGYLEQKITDEDIDC